MGGGVRNSDGCGKGIELLKIRHALPRDIYDYAKGIATAPPAKGISTERKGIAILRYYAKRVPWEHLVASKGIVKDIEKTIVTKQKVL